VAEFTFYYVNDHAQPNGDHEVHKKSCKWLAMAVSTTYLGYYPNCRDAVSKARTVYSKANGCPYCCPECHKS